MRFGDGGERQIGADELLVINSGTIHAVTAYPNQAIVLQVPYEMLLQYMEHYDQLYFVVDERPASEAEKQNSQNSKQFSEMDEVYGAQKEGYQLYSTAFFLKRCTAYWWTMRCGSKRTHSAESEGRTADPRGHAVY